MTTPNPEPTPPPAPHLAVNLYGVTPDTVKVHDLHDFVIVALGTPDAVVTVYVKTLQDLMKLLVEAERQAAHLDTEARDAAAAVARDGGSV